MRGSILLIRIAIWVSGSSGSAVVTWLKCCLTIYSGKCPLLLLGYATDCAKLLLAFVPALRAGKYEMHA